PGLNALRANRHALGVAVGHGSADADLDTELLERSLCRLGKRRVERWQQSRSGFDEKDVGTCRVDRSEIRGEGALRQFSKCARKLDAGRSAAHDYEVAKPVPLDRIRFGLRLFEREQNPTPQISRVIDRLQPRRKSRPLGMTEVGVLRPGGDKEMIEADAEALRLHLLVCETDA